MSPAQVGQYWSARSLNGIAPILPCAGNASNVRAMPPATKDLLPGALVRVAAAVQRLLAPNASMMTGLSWWASNERIRSISQVEGREHLDAALAKGKGVILLSAHFTTLEMGARILAALVPLNIMYRPTKNECLSHFLARNRGRRAKRAIRRDDVRSLISALRQNECVWYAPDQSYRKKGAEMVRLFGIPAATNTATSRLAQMTGATVLPYFAERLPGGRGYRAVIHPPLEDFPSACTIADAETFSRMIETQVRVVPEQYLWIHKRFKGLTEDYPDYYGRRAPRSA